MNCHYHPEVPSAAFCQFCGKPLCKDCIRNVGGAVYCEACLTERLRAAGAPAAAAFSTGTPRPMLAGLLGCIPGVGAMYNGQYAKAIAHVLIFAVLASLSDHGDSGGGVLFGILLTAWVFYQVFDAYQTAAARRDGQPLPNPFGLNDIAQRLGLHTQPVVDPKTWAGGAPGPVPPAAGFVPPAGVSWSSQPPYPPPPPQVYTTVPNQPYPPPAPLGPFGAQRDLPVGAIILIGLGFIFLMVSLGLVRGAFVAHAWPLLIIGLGVWIIVRRTRTAPPMPPPPDAYAASNVAPGVHTDPNRGGR